MAKKKDFGEYIQIRYIQGRDSLNKFKKVLRHFLQNEKRDIVADMVSAPQMPTDFLNSLVYSAKALQTLGFHITFMITPENYMVIKDSENASFFQFEIVQMISDQEISEMRSASSEAEQGSSFYSVKGDTIFVEQEGIDNIPKNLAKSAKEILQTHSQVILSLTKLSSLSGEIVQGLIVHALDFGDDLQIHITSDLLPCIEANSQSAILNLHVVKKPAPDEITAEIADFALLPEPEEESFVLPDTSPAKTSKPVAAPIPEISQPPATWAPSGDFQLDVNCLYVGEMSPNQFLRDFPSHFERLSCCGEQFYLDLSDYENLEDEILQYLFDCYIAAKKQRKNLVFRLLETQRKKMERFFPSIQEVTKRKVARPSFEIIGGHLEIRDVDQATFVEQFPEHFKKLLATGLSNLIVDICHLNGLSTQAVELLVLSYLDAVGRGATMMFRIRPEMEDAFVRSGRGRSLPLEIVKPELGGQSALHHHKQKVESIDMNKVLDGMGDRLTSKVLNQQYETVHIESRGSIHNWTPAPVQAGDRIVDYNGPERRKERRYISRGLQVSFGKGSIGKIADRRYALHNLSQSGACFTSSVQFSKAEPLRLKLFSMENIGTEVSAKVIWIAPVPTQALFRVGVQFTKISPIAKAQISAILKSLHQSNG